MGAISSQISSFPIGYSTVYSGSDQRKHQSSASLAFVRGIHRSPVNSPHKWPVTRKIFPYDDVIMWSMPQATFMVVRTTGFVKMLLSLVLFTDWPTIVTVVRHWGLIARVQANGSQYPKFTTDNRPLAWLQVVVIPNTDCLLMYWMIYRLGWPEYALRSFGACWIE